MRSKRTSSSSVPKVSPMLEALGSDDTRVNNYARFCLGVLTIEQVAALEGVTPEQALVNMTSPDMAARVDKAAAEFEGSGAAARMRAGGLLNESLRRLSDTVAGGECSPSFLLRLAEVMGKLSAEPKDERKEATGPTFAINIDLGGGNSVSLKGTEPLTLDANTGELVTGNTVTGWQA